MLRQTGQIDVHFDNSSTVISIAQNDASGLTAAVTQCNARHTESRGRTENPTANSVSSAVQYCQRISRTCAVLCSLHMFDERKDSNQQRQIAVKAVGTRADSSMQASALKALQTVTITV
eukprot:14132-Heterococcus_DN1.PRE.12